MRRIETAKNATIVLLGTVAFSAASWSSQRNRDRIKVIEDRLAIQPADVLEEVKAAREEFRSSRFTHADGERMSERIDQIVKDNHLKETSK